MVIVSSPLHTVAESPQFIRDATAAGLSSVEVAGIVDAVAADPQQGVEVRGSGGVRKIRIAGRGKGKSGGYRVMIAYLGPESPIYLLALLSKSDRENFSEAEIAAMKAVTTAIRQKWRERRRK